MNSFLYFSSGDLDFFWKEQIQRLSWLPNVFRKDVSFGQSSLMSLWLDYPFRLILKLFSTIGLSWFVIEKILWASVFILAITSSYRLAKYVLRSRLSAWLAGFIYIANTYFLLLFSGGQLGVALAYAFAPFVSLQFMKFIDTKNLKVKATFINGLSFALLVGFDLRLAYLTFGMIMLYGIWKKTFHFFHIGISLFIAGLLHLFWILPILMTHIGTAALGEDFTNPGMLKFLSFADLSHTLTLLHPNWPENLFGKVYFLQPEFLIIPILAFAALLWINHKKENNEKIFYFAIISLIGAFFAKGVQSPAGDLFQWCFLHIPGFVMFRDPTKFYLLTAIGYSILIPFTLLKLSDRFTKKKVIIYILFSIFWIISIRAVFTCDVKGNFRPVSLPQEYIRFKDQLVDDAIASRTLWIPRKENFAYYSDTHPVLQLDQLFKDASLSEVPKIATSSAFISVLKDSGVRYVVVPIDVERKMFMSDYVYNEAMRQEIIVALKQTNLIKDPGYAKLAVFENPEFQGINIIIPNIVPVQQRYANIGVMVSGIVFVFSVLIIVCF